MSQENNSVTVTLQCERLLTYEIELPWPGPLLSPNSRPHWAALARAKKAYRSRCRAIGQGQGLSIVKNAAKAVLVHLEFIPPDKRARDWDNLVASMKSGLDGLADAMGVDDSKWRLSFDVAGETVKGGLVVVRVEVTT